MAKDDPERAARLAAALRQNLLRRKAQARGLEAAPEASAAAPDAAPAISPPEAPSPR